MQERACAMESLPITVNVGEVKCNGEKLEATLWPGRKETLARLLLRRSDKGFWLELHFSLDHDDAPAGAIDMMQEFIKLFGGYVAGDADTSKADASFSMHAFSQSFAKRNYTHFVARIDVSKAEE